MKALKTLVVGSFVLLFLGSTVHADNMSVEKKKVVQNNAQQALQKAQKKVVDDAAQGIQLTYKALSEIKDNKLEEAKVTLVNASKSFDKAKNEKENFVTTAVFMDVVSGVDTPEEAAGLMNLAEEAIATSNPQVARDLLSPLVSEIDIVATEIPVVTYKDYVNKAVVALDKQDKAKAEENLLDAIGTSIMVSEVIPIPTLLAEADLNEASSIVNKDVDKALRLLKDAEEQIALNDILGYEHTDAFKQNYKSVRKRIVSAHHQEVWNNIKMKLGLIKENNAKNTDKAAVAKVNEAVSKIEQKSVNEKTNKTK